jgi:sigma-B regulation protein RsbU (phosphoserine phosphatase)
MQLQWARQIQSQLFPAEPLAKPGLHIDALNDPGQKVSGDYYDYFFRADGLVAVVVADVAGKGVPASLLMANLQAGVHVMLAAETDLVAAVVQLNELVCRNVSGGRFITAMFGLLDPGTNVFRYVNAGHLGPYVLRASGRAEKFTPEPSLPLGIETDFEYTEGEIKLDDAPVTLFLYTDGIPEAENEAGEQYGEQRLQTALENNTAQPPAELVSRVRRSIKQFTRNHAQTDDITIVAVRLE